MCDPLTSFTARRVLAEQHIALSDALDDPFHFFNDMATSPSQAQSSDGEHVGIIYTSLKVASVVEKSIRLLKRLFQDEIDAGVRQGDEAVIPEIVVDGTLEARFAYIPEHLEYIIFELLKNSMMAVMRQALPMRDPVCIRVTIVEGPPDEDLIIRISDCGGGLPDMAAKAPASKREHRRRLSNRAASRKRREALDEETAAVRGDQRDVSLDGDAALSEETHQDDEIAMSESRPVMGLNRELANATVNKAGISDPLITTVTSFSNIRRRLEMEKARLKREGRGKRLEGEQVDNVSRRESPGGEKEGIGMGLRAGLQGQEERASGIDSWVKLEAIRNVGRFKGTVAEQVSTSRRRVSMAEPGVEQEQEQAHDEADDLDLPPAHHNRAETGLGLPMTKIYTDFFGGSLSLRSLDGHGMDVFVRLPKLGTNKEAIEDIVL